jgi:hypothetical protein
MGGLRRMPKGLEVSIEDHIVTTTLFVLLIAIVISKDIAKRGQRLCPFG